MRTVTNADCGKLTKTAKCFCVLAPPEPTLLSPELYCDYLLEDDSVVINWMVY